MKKINILLAIAFIISGSLSATSLNGVSPGAGVKGTSIGLTLSGHGFVGSTSYAVTFTHLATSYTIAGRNVEFVDSNTLGLTLDIPANADTGFYQVSVSGGTGSNMTLDNAFTVLQTVQSGINEVNTSQLYTYPNPAISDLYIESEQPIAEIILSSLRGQQILNQQSSGSRDILDVQGVPSGMYILRVTDHSGNILFRKIVIE